MVPGDERNEYLLQLKLKFHESLNGSLASLHPTDCIHNQHLLTQPASTHEIECTKTGTEEERNNDYETIDETTLPSGQTFSMYLVGKNNYDVYQ
jgi:hypothetical protein